MRTTRKTTKAASENGNRGQKRKNNRPRKTNSRQKENKPTPGLDDFQGVQKQVSNSQMANVSELVVSVKEEDKTTEKPPSCPDVITECTPKDVGKPKRAPFTQLLQQQATNELLVARAGCLNQVKYEIIDAGCHGNELMEATDITAHCSGVDNGPSATVVSSKVEPESNVTNPATGGTVMKADKLPNSQSNRKTSALNGSYKLYRFMICEWFYSHIDRPLFAEGSNQNMEMGALLKEHFPSLFTRTLNRAQWNHIRKKLRTKRPVRRFSHAFVLEERMKLERRREKLRFLMENPMIEYLDDDIPTTVPEPIVIGSTVRVTSFHPHYGCYVGEVIGVKKREIPFFLVRFTDASEQLLPDYRVALEQSFHVAEALDTVSVALEHVKQIELLGHKLQEKVRLLHGLENIRLNLAGRHAMGKLDPKQDREQLDRYDQIVRKLLNLNRSMQKLMKQIAADYVQYMSEPLTLEDDGDVPVVDQHVVDAADQLLAGYAQLDTIHDNPAADQLWQTTIQRLHNQPVYLQQFEVYLASKIGTTFVTTPGTT